MADFPTPRRRYTRKEKLSAVLAAEVGGLTVASEKLGIPKATLFYWLQKPEYEQFRTKTREDEQDVVRVAFHLLWKRVVETASEMEPRDALFGAEKAATILALLTGQATSRTETRDVTDSLNDHETQTLRDAIDTFLREAVEA